MTTFCIMWVGVKKVCIDMPSLCPNNALIQVKDDFKVDVEIDGESRWISASTAKEVIPLFRERGHHVRVFFH